MKCPPPAHGVCLFRKLLVATQTKSNEGKIQLLSSSSLDTGLSGFNLADFIAPEIARYLGVRSLVRFGATSKYNFAVMTDEIYCRKKCVADIENVVMSLMMTVSHPFRTPTRNEYSQASAAATLCHETDR